MLDLYSSIQMAIGATLRVFDFIDRKPKIDPEKGRTLENDEIQGKVTFKNVTFSYESRPDAIVLDNFNMVLKPNTITALVGISGSGKSTISSLLMRLYDPIFGKISIDSNNLKKLKVSSYHEHVGEFFSMYVDLLLCVVSVHPVEK